MVIKLIKGSKLVLGVVNQKFHLPHKILLLCRILSFTFGFFSVVLFCVFGVVGWIPLSQEPAVFKI